MKDNNSNEKVYYDWFKGKKNNKSKKNKIKETFKWIKIFLYFCLFTFSMFGCVQVFAIGSNTKVGQGIELFNNEDEISPFVSNVDFTKSYTYSVNTDDPDFPKAVVPKEGASIGEEMKSVYGILQNEKTNTWINKFEDKELLKNLQTFLNDQQGVKLKDAYKGINQSYKINLSEEKTFNYSTEPGSSSDSYDKSFKASSLAEDITNGANINKAKSIFFKNDENKPVIYSSVAKKYNSVYFEDSVTSYTFYIPVFNGYEEVQKEGKKYYKPTYQGIPMKFEWSNDSGMSEEKKVQNKMGADLVKYYKELEPNAFGFAFDSAQEATDYLNETLFFVKTTKTEGSGSINDVSFKNPRYDQLWNEKIGICNQMLLNTGIKTEEKTNSQNVNIITAFKQDKFPSANAIETNWRPITSWGESWSLGPFYGLFVYPISLVTNSILNSMGLLDGWETISTIIIVVFTIRLLTFLLSFKGSMQQQKMQDLSSKKAMIEAKYAKYAGNKQMEMRKRQEVAKMYEKEGINPLSSVGTAFLTMPLFLAIFKVIGGIPHIKAASWMGIVFSDTSWRMLFAGSLQYLPLILVAVLIQGFSQYYPKLLNRKKDKLRMNKQQKDALRKSNKTQNIMTYVMIFMAAIFTAGIQIYWIIGGIWRIIESSITHKVKKVIKNKKTIT